MSHSIPPERRHHITSTTVTSPDTPANRPNSSYTASIQCGWVFTGEITSRRLNRSSRRIFIWFFEFVGGVKLFVWSAHVVLKFFRYRVFPLRDHSLRESVSLNNILYGDRTPQIGMSPDHSWKNFSSPFWVTFTIGVPSSSAETISTRPLRSRLLSWSSNTSSGSALRIFRFTSRTVFSSGLPTSLPIYG